MDTHTIEDLSEESLFELVKSFITKKPRKKFLFPQEGNLKGTPYICELVRFEKDEKIRVHSHSDGRVYKIILNPKGYLKYGTKKGSEDQDFKFGEIAWVEPSVTYSTVILNETDLLILTPPPSSIIVSE
ncbi:MAG: hypothetical protein AAGG81_08370 [Chlamydiota bacterium]